MKYVTAKKPFLLFIALTLLFFIPKANADTLTINQSAQFPEGYNLLVSANSRIQNGFVLVKSPDRLPHFSPELYSFGFKTTPIPEIAFLGGSISTTGLPSRAKNPVFNLYGPLYTPVTISGEALLQNSNTKNTENLALEVSVQKWKMASFVAMPLTQGDPSWVILSRTNSLGKKKEIAVSFSVIGGTYQLEKEINTSWFLNDPQIPDTRVWMPGAELLLQKKKASFSCATFANLGNFRKPSMAIRTDGSWKCGIITFKGGVYTADRTFRNMSGTSDSILNRLFFAPSLDFSLLASKKIKVTWAVIGISDTERGVKYFQDDIKKYSAGSALYLASPKGRLQTKIMSGDEDFVVSASGTVFEFVVKTLECEIEGKATVSKQEKGTFFPTERVVSTHLTFTPLRNCKSTLGLCRTDKQTSNEGVYELKMTQELNFFRQNREWTLSGNILFISDVPGVSGSLYLKTVIR